MPVSASFHPSMQQPSARAYGTARGSNMKPQMQSWSSPQPPDSYRQDYRQSDTAAFGSDDYDATVFYAKQNEALSAENEELKSRLNAQQVELDLLEAAVAKMKADAQRQAQMDKVMGKGKGGKEKRREETRASIDADRAEEALAEELKPAATSATAAKAASRRSKAAKADSRKMLDDFKRPLEDTRAILSEFADKGHQVPIVLAIGQAESMQEALRDLQSEANGLNTRINDLRARFPKGRVVGKAKQMRFDEALANLRQEQRRVDHEMGALGAPPYGPAPRALARAPRHSAPATPLPPRAFAPRRAISWRLAIRQSTQWAPAPRSGLHLLNRVRVGSASRCAARVALGRRSRRLRCPPRRRSLSDVPRAPEGAGDVQQGIRRPLEAERRRGRSRESGHPLCTPHG